MIKTSVPNYFSQRRDRLMQQAGNAAIILTSNPIQRRNFDVDYEFRQDSNLYYLTGYDEPNVFVVLLPGKDKKKHRMIMFVQERNQEKEIWVGERYGTERVGEIFGADEAYPVTLFDQMLPKMISGVEKVYVQMGIFPLQDQRMIALIKQVTDQQGRTGKSLLTIQDPSALIGEMRLFKSEEEIALMKKGCSATARAHMQVMKEIRPGMNEHDIEALIEYLFKKNGCERVAYGSIVASGKNATCLHYVENNCVVKDGDLILIDAAGEQDYYSSDITRTFPVGRSFTKEQAQVYDAVLAVQKECVELVKPGKTYADVQNRAREMLINAMLELGLIKGSPKEILDNKSYMRLYPHNIGHWLGMDTHDTGLYQQNTSSRAFEPGMVITIEPGIYVQPYDKESPENYRGIGVRIEDDILVTKSGPDNLTHEVVKERSDIEKLRQY
jgi:Xaa-Pro aminopeptidase